MLIILTSLVSTNNFGFKVSLVSMITVAQKQKNNFLAAIYEYGLWYHVINNENFISQSVNKLSNEICVKCSLPVSNMIFRHLLYAIFFHIYIIYILLDG